MNFKCNGVYVCSLDDNDFKPGKFLSKNNKLKLVDNVYNIVGYQYNSAFNMKKTFFFISFYEDNDEVIGASFGYSWMNPLDIADTFIGDPNDSSKRMMKLCDNFKINGEFVNFSYFQGEEEFEIRCRVAYPNNNYNTNTPYLFATVKNKSTSVECQYMHFRFIERVEEKDLNNREYNE